MKKLLLATVALVVLGAPALAADLRARPYTKAPPPIAAPIYNWTGFYIGAHGGIANGNTTGAANIGGLFNVSTDFSLSGGIYGGHAGYNHHVGQVVFGIEGTLSGLELSGDTTCVILFRCSRSLDWLATVRGRVGVAMDRAMVYGLIGIAWADVQTDVRDNVLGIFALDGGETHVGWVAGIGLEYAVTNRVIARIEYNHIDLGSETHTLGASLGGIPLGFTLPSKVDVTIDTIKLGVSVKLP